MADVSSINSYFTALITDMMAIERQPLARLQEQYDTLNVRKGAYADVKTQLGDLQKAVAALISTEYTPSLPSGRSAAVTQVESGFSVLTASANSTAIPGTYQISVSTLAMEHRVRSDQQLYADQALGLAGAILMGGDASRSVANAAGLGTTVTDFAAAPSIASDQRELGNGTYYVETRQDAVEGWQFRLVDSEGNAVSIRQGTSDAYTSIWQAITPGSYDTGRGLTISFGDEGYQAASRGSIPAAAQVDYRSQGASIEILATDNLNDIASKINGQDYAQGNAVVATIVDRHLVIASAATGASRQITASGSVLTALGVLGVDGGSSDTGAADGFKNTIQVGSDASFTVNGVVITRSQNTGLTNVIGGVTLHLAADAQNKSATLTIQPDWTEARSKIDEFISKFNSVQTYLENKTAITSQISDGTTTYTRGTLASDNIFSELRGDLFSMFMSEYAAGQKFSTLREIGLTIDDNLKATVSDPEKLEAALGANLDDVTALLDQVMQAFDVKLSRFTGTTTQTGYLDSVITSFGIEINDINADIKDMNEYLAGRETFLADQYAQMQAQLISLTYTQQMWAGIYGSVSQYY